MANSRAKFKGSGVKKSPCLRTLWIRKFSHKCLPIQALLYILVTENHWVYGLHPSSGILNNHKTQCSGKWVFFHLQVRGGRHLLCWVPQKDISSISWQPMRWCEVTLRRSVGQSVSHSVSQYVLVSSTLVGLATRYYFLSECCCLKFEVLFLWVALSDERTGLQFAV
jgi:hypothetical protein